MVTDLTDIRWCCGFTGASGALVVAADGSCLITDSRYREQAPEELAVAGADCEVVISAGVIAAATEWLGNRADVALQADHVTWAQQRRWAAALDHEPLAIEELVLELRSVKDHAELERMGRAAAVVDEVLADLAPLLVEGTSGASSPGRSTTGCGPGARRGPHTRRSWPPDPVRRCPTPARATGGS
ncbi:MAG: aminopeptidase P family N-terminal domain-containing protein [Acidimicrobiales bacterium]